MIALRRWLLALAAGLVLTVPAVAVSAEPTVPAWTPYENPDFGARVDFPAAPTTATIRKVIAAGPIVRTTAQVEVGDGILLLWMTRYENGPLTDPQATLRAAADSIPGNLGGPEISRTPLTLGGAPALDFLGGPSSDGLYVRERMIVRGDVLYQLIAIAPGAPPPETDRFQASFAFLDPAVGR